MEAKCKFCDKEVEGGKQNCPLSPTKKHLYQGTKIYTEEETRKAEISMAKFLFERAKKRRANAI